jgi:hypothetical protein
MKLFLTLLNALAACLFLAGAAVQYNDPDPGLWVTAYGVGALACGLYAAGRLPVALAAALGAAFAGGGLMLMLEIAGPATFLDLTGTEMMGVTEGGREMVGLFLIALWMGVLALAGRRAAAGRGRAVGLSEAV